MQSTSLIGVQRDISDATKEHKKTPFLSIHT